MGFDHLGLYLYTGRKPLAPAMTRDPQDALEYIDRTGSDYFIVQSRQTRNEEESLDVKFQNPVLEQYPERFSLEFTDPPIPLPSTVFMGSHHKWPIPV